MDMDNYQEYAASKSGMVDNTCDERLAVFSLGLTEEAGEVAGLIKKYLGHGHMLDNGLVKRELGDVLWYVAMVADNCGISLNEVAKANQEKLNKRYPGGFSIERSLNREEAKDE